MRRSERGMLVRGLVICRWDIDCRDCRDFLFLL